MISVCVRNLDRNYLLYSLLQMYPEYTQEKKLLDKLGLELAEDEVKNGISERKVSSWDMDAAETFFDFCYDEVNNSTEVCQFVLLLSAMSDALTEYIVTEVKDYILDRARSQTRPTLEDLQSYIEESHSPLSLDRYKKMPKYKFWSHFENLVSLYALFFSLFSKMNLMRY